MQIFQNVSDSQLLHLCEKFGRRALHWRAKFIGLLPEVDRRKLYEKRGFNSIFEFAYKFAGLSQEQVRLALNLERRFGDKPNLKSLLINGEVSINKLARVASIATNENEAELAERVQVLPKSTLETFIRDHRSHEEKKDDANGNGLKQTLFEDKSVPGHTLAFEISQENIQKLNQLHSQGHDVNKIISTLLQKRYEEIQNKKEELGQQAKPVKSRAIPAKIKAILHEEFGTKCSIPGCKKLSGGTHHSQFFSLTRTHDPRYMAPMCPAHHDLAHLSNLKYQKKKSCGNEF